MNEASKIEYEIINCNVKLIQIFAKGNLNVALKELCKVILAVMLATHEVKSIEIARVVLAQVTDEVLINDFVSDCRRIELFEAELNGILIQCAL